MFISKHILTTILHAPFAHLECRFVKHNNIIGQSNHKIFAGTLYLHQHCAGIACAIKELDTDIDQGTEVAQIANMLYNSGAGHSNIVTIYGTCKNWIVMEHMHCSLYDVLHTNNFAFMKNNSVICKMERMIWCANAIYFLHSRGMAHRDVKSPNLLFPPDFATLKLCDFGSIKIPVKQNQWASIQTLGTVEWAAPELLLGQELSNEKANSADVYSLGIVLCEIWLQKPPFHGIEQLKIIRMNKPTEMPYKMHDITYYLLKRTISKCLEYNSSDRIRIEQVVTTLQTMKLSYQQQLGIISVQPGLNIVGVCAKCQQQSIVHLGMSTIELEQVHGYSCVLCSPENLQNWKEREYLIVKCSYSIAGGNYEGDMNMSGDARQLPVTIDCTTFDSWVWASITMDK